MYCTKCGVQIHDDVNFCSACGAETAKGAQFRRASTPNYSEPKRLYRSFRDRKIAGVCGGLAHFWGADPTLIRLAWVLMTFISCGIGLLAYLAAWIIVPLDPYEGVVHPVTAQPST